MSFRTLPPSLAVYIFFNDKRELLEQITDFQLSCLLIRVDACNVTWQIVMIGCCSIHGPGLTPLRNSRVLEQIDLAGTGADQNPVPFISVLRNMIPHALNEVRLSDECKMNFSQEVSDFSTVCEYQQGRNFTTLLLVQSSNCPWRISRDSLNQTRAVTLLFVVYYVKRSIVHVPAVR
jgi:hypothetical protein